MVKSYLRYVPADVFGVISSAGSNVVVSKSGQTVYTPELESVGVWSLQSGRQTGLLRSSGDYEERGTICRLALVEGKAGQLAAGDTNGRVVVWNTFGAGGGTGGDEKMCLAMHRSPVTALAFGPDGTSLASGGMDTRVVVYDTVSGTATMRLGGHADQITDLAFADGGRRLVSSSKDKLVKVFDLDTQHCLHTVAGHTSEVWSVGFDAALGLLVTATASEMLRVFTVGTAPAVTSSNDGGTPDLDIPETQQKLELRRTGTHRPLSVKWYDVNAGGAGSVVDLPGDDDFRKLLVVCTSDGVDAWLVRTQQAAQKAKKRRLKRAAAKAAAKAAASGMNKEGDNEDGDGGDGDDDDSLVDSFVQVVSLTCKHKVSSAELCRPPLDKRSKRQKRAAAPGSSGEERVTRIVVGYANNRFEAFDVTVAGGGAGAMAGGGSKTKAAAWKYVSAGAVTAEGHANNVRSMALSSDNAMVASTCSSQLKLWHLDTRLCARTVEAKYGLCCVFVPDNRHVVVGSKSGTIDVYDVASGTNVESVQGHSASVWSLALHPSGKFFASASADKDVKFWAFQLVSDPKRPGAAPRLGLRHEKSLSMTDEVLDVTFSRDGQFVAVSLLDSTVKVFYEDTLKFFLSMYGHKLPVLCIDTSTDGDLMVTGSGDKNVKIWGLDFGDCHSSLFAHDGAVTQVSFIADTHHFLSAGKDGLVKYWDADSFERITTIKAHFDDVTGLCVLSTGTGFLTASKDRSIRVFDQSEDQIFLDDERERETERRMDNDLATLEGAAAAGAQDSGGWGAAADPGAAAVVASASGKALTDTERLIDALEEADREIAASGRVPSYGEGLRAGAKPQSALLAALKQTPEEHVKKALASIQNGEMATALSLLPFSHAARLIKYLAVFLAEDDELEVPLACVGIVLRVFHRQLTASPALADTLKVLHRHIRKQLGVRKGLVGVNLAHLGMLEVDGRTAASQFEDAFGGDGPNAEGRKR